MLALLSFSVAQAETPAKPVVGHAPTLDDFYAKPVFSHASLSPDGHYLAYVVDKGSQLVVVEHLDDMQSKAILNIATKGASVDRLDWKDNNRLVLSYSVFDIEHYGNKDRKSVG